MTSEQLLSFDWRAAKLDLPEPGDDSAQAVAAVPVGDDGITSDRAGPFVPAWAVDAVFHVLAPLGELAKPVCLEGDEEGFHGVSIR